MSLKAATDAPKLAPVVWDLTHVIPTSIGPEFDALLARLERAVLEFETWRPRLDALDNAKDVANVLNLAADIVDLVQRLDGWGSLSFSVDTASAPVKAYMARMDEVSTDVGNRMRFFDLWWKAIPDDRALALRPDAPDIQYYLDRMRVFRPHTLTEPEEKLVAIKDVTGTTAIDRIREILTSGFRFRDPKTGATVTQSELVKHVHDPDPTARESTYRELWRVYGANEAVLSYVYQTVVTDWRNEKVKVRKYPTPISVRNKWNDVPDDAVETLLDVCHANRGVFQRYFAWKGKRLGLTPMSRFHLYAPLDEKPMDVPYETAREKALRVFREFSPDVGREARKVFDEQHVHAYPAPSKRGGAYCATVVSRLTPYVFMNYTGDASSVKTLAHEMGHAIHSLLARDRHPFVAHSSLPMAETASVFAEMLLHRELMHEADDAQKTAILSEKIGEMYATVMRQAYFVRFENHAHDAIANGATADDLKAWYLSDLREQLAGVHVPDEFALEWTYVPHIYASPFYCYSYSFGMLLSLALYGRYEREGPAFVPHYTKLLASGGSASAATLLGRVGVDINDRGFWQAGFDVIDRMQSELERLGG